MCVLNILTMISCIDKCQVASQDTNAQVLTWDDWMKGSVDGENGAESGQKAPLPWSFRCSLQISPFHFRDLPKFQCAFVLLRNVDTVALVFPLQSGTRQYK